MFGPSTRRLALACGLLAVATPALALPSQTWVSASGTDTGICPATSPCRTFQYAFTQTASAGVISVLSSGEYGAVTIDRSVSIIAVGAEGAIFKGGNGAAIVVNGSNIDVWLRGLTIDLFGATFDGIKFVTGAALHVQDCTIRSTAIGINFAPISGAGELYVSDSTITKVSSHGLVVQPTGGASAKAILTRVHVENVSGNGMAFMGAAGAINAAVNDSVSAGNQGNGIYALGGGSAPVSVMIDRSASVGNTARGVASTSALIRIGDSTVTGNNVGFSVGGGGTIASYSSNKVNGNNVDGSPTTVTYK
jgi:hypothetical protein